MLVFLDFEASSLARKSYPIEVAWAGEDGGEEAYLIRPAPDWTDWSAEAEAIHGIPRDQLLREGHEPAFVAKRMMEVLAGHDLLASAPSWDGKWLSSLLRAAGLPRHSLRLRRSDDALREAASALLAPSVPAEELGPIVATILAEITLPAFVDRAHRALADARAERERWRLVRKAALERIAGWAPSS